MTLPLAAALLGMRSSGRALDPQSPAPAGARALAQLLEQGGVPVQRVTRAAAAAEALTAGDDATLVVTDPALVDPDRLAELASAASAVVLLQPDTATVSAVAPALQVGAGGAGGDAPVTTALPPVAAPGTSAAPVVSLTGPPVEPAGCEDPDALAAGEATSGTSGPDARAEPLVAVGPGAQVCFAGAYASASTPDGVPVRVFALDTAVSNDLLDVAGNAALALRAAGSAPRVVWLVASPLDAAPDAAPSTAQLLPGWVAPVAAQLGLVALAAVVWRSRRFGALVVEPLPVVVHSVETARGRAALYRAARDRAAAARSLRAAVRWRLAVRLGLPPSTAPEVVASAAAHAAGRGSGSGSGSGAGAGSGSGAGAVAAVGAAALLTGPPPTDDAALATLLRDLDALEAAVARGVPSAPKPSHDAHPEETP